MDGVETSTCLLVVCAEPFVCWWTNLVVSLCWYISLFAALEVWRQVQVKIEAICFSASECHTELFHNI